MRTGQWDGKTCTGFDRSAGRFAGTKIIGYAEATAEFDFIADALDVADFLGLGSRDFLRFSRLGHRNHGNARLDDAAFSAAMEAMSLPSRCM